jgi:rhamnose transport system substrate-binding protein
VNLKKLETASPWSKFLALGAAAVVAVGLTGCATAPSDSADETSAEPETSSEETDESVETEALDIVYIPKNLGNPYFDNIVAGLEEAGPELNMNVEVVGPAQAGATDQIQYIDAAIQQQVDAILISPNDNDALVPSLQRAMDAGIAVISVNSDMNPEGRQLAILPTDFNQLGEFLVELTAEVTGGSGDFAILSATSTAPDQNFWIEGMREVLSGGAYPDLNLVDVVYGDDAPDKSTNETNALLTRYPDLDAIVAPTTVGVAAAAQVLSASPRKGEVQVTGLGTPNEMRQYIKDETVSAVALWDPKAQGILAAHLAAALIDGSLVAEPGASLDVPGLGDRVVNDDTQVITGPPVTFTAENIDDFDY